MKIEFQYLMKKSKPKVAHIWLGDDTACRMYSTGGMRKRRNKVADSDCGLPICTMCENVMQPEAGRETGDICLDALNRIKNKEK